MSCTTDIKIPDTEVCAVSGVMAAGADCVNTLSYNQRSMTLDQWVDFLEPQQMKVIDGKVVRRERGPALCQSSEDWNKQKTELEKICKKIGAACTYEMQKQIDSFKINSEYLQSETIRKRSEFKGH